MRKITPKRYGSITPIVIKETPDPDKVATAQAIIDFNSRLTKLEGSVK